MKTSLAIVAALTASIGFATPAFADFNQFLQATCGAGCNDPIGERTSTTANWSSLGEMGTREFIGATVDGVTIDPSGLLAAARIVGAPEIDRWLRSGQASSAEVSDAIMGAISSYAGIDLTGIVGREFSTAAIGNQTDVTSVLANFNTSSIMQGFGPGGGGVASCDPTIDKNINAAAKGYVESVVEAAESEQYGFSQVGGQSVGSNKRSEAGVFGGSCLDIFMTGDKDILFRPPQLSQLVDMLGSMFGEGAGGEGGGGSCAGMPTVHEQIAASMPNSAFETGNGGFFPGEFFASDESGDSLVNSDTSNGMRGVGVVQRVKSSVSFATLF